MLEKLIEIAPLYRKAIREDVSIGISDREVYLAFFEADGLKFPFPVGTRMRDVGYGEVLDEILRTGQPYFKYFSREETGGIPLKTMVTPVYDGGVIVGCISATMNLEREEQIERYSEVLKDSIVAEEMQKLADQCKNVTDQVEEILLTIQENILQTAQLTQNANAASEEQFGQTEQVADYIDRTADKCNEMFQYLKS